MKQDAWRKEVADIRTYLGEYGSRTPQRCTPNSTASRSGWSDRFKGTDGRCPSVLCRFPCRQNFVLTDIEKEVPTA